MPVFTPQQRSTLEKTIVLTRKQSESSKLHETPDAPKAPAKGKGKPKTKKIELQTELAEPLPF